MWSYSFLLVVWLQLFLAKQLYCQNCTCPTEVQLGLTSTEHVVRANVGEDVVFKCRRNCGSQYQNSWYFSTLQDRHVIVQCDPGASCTTKLTNYSITSEKLEEPCKNNSEVIFRLTVKNVTTNMNDLLVSCFVSTRTDLAEFYLNTVFRLIVTDDKDMEVDCIRELERTMDNLTNTTEELIRVTDEIAKMQKNLTNTTNRLVDVVAELEDTNDSLQVATGRLSELNVCCLDENIGCSSERETKANLTNCTMDLETANDKIDKLENKIEELEYLEWIKTIAIIELVVIIILGAVVTLFCCNYLKPCISTTKKYASQTSTAKSNGSEEIPMTKKKCKVKSKKNSQSKHTSEYQHQGATGTAAGLY